MNQVVAEKLNNFFQKQKLIKYKKGTILIEPDQTPSGIFYLKEGVVKMYAISPDGEELILNLFKQNTLFPVDYALNNTLPKQYFEAMTPVALYRTTSSEFLKLIKKNNDILLDLLRRIYFGLEGFFLRMEYLMSGSASNRLITEILIFAKRFGYDEKGKFIVDFKLTEKDLAAQSGMTRETVSREIKKLENKGLLNYKKSILTINNLENLEKYLVDSGVGSRS